MTELPDQEQLNRFRIEENVKSSEKRMSEERDDDSGYVENELDLKSNIVLKPKAERINPMNVSDLILGIVKDENIKKKLEYWKEMQVIFHEAGMNETAKFYSDMVLTTLNLHRSHDGKQQIYIISRVKQTNLKLEDEKKSLAERSKTI